MKRTYCDDCNRRCIPDKTITNDDGYTEVHIQTGKPHTPPSYNRKGFYHLCPDCFARLEQRLDHYDNNRGEY